AEGTDALPTAAVEEAEVEGGGGVPAAAAVAASRRTRPRKSAATRRIRATAAVVDGGAATPLREPGVDAPATLAAMPPPPPAVVAAGPGPLASPLPKRRRISEAAGSEGCEHPCSVGTTAPAAAAAAAAGVPTDAQQPARPCTTLFPSASGPSPCTIASKAVLQVLSDVGGASGSATFGSSIFTGAAAAAAAGCTNESVIAAPASAGRLAQLTSAPLELQLTEQEQNLAAAVRNACMALESALTVRRHDLAALHTAEQAAAAAAAAAATMAAAAAAAVAAEPQVAAVAAEDAATTQTAKKKVGRPRAVAGATLTRGKQAAAMVPPPSPPPAVVAAAPPAPAPVAMPIQPIAVADEVFLSRTYRGVSKKLNFDDL
ncbi:hypothetical protein Vretifemale_12211, partial [Volvox reticuliferus]